MSVEVIEVVEVVKVVTVVKASKAVGYKQNNFRICRLKNYRVFSVQLLYQILIVSVVDVFTNTSDRSFCLLSVRSNPFRRRK